MRPSFVRGACWGARCRGAFTLIELMIVIALMLAIAAVVIPLSLDDAKRAAMREAEAQLEAAMLSARADAQRMGRSVRLVALASDDVWLIQEEEPATQAGSGDAARSARLIQEIALPRGVRLARTREEAEGLAPGAADQPAVSADPDSGDSVASLQVAMILPDGQITPTRPLYLGAPDGRTAEVVMNSWTGAVSVNVLAPRTGDADAPGDEPAGPDTDEQEPPARGKPGGREPS